MKESLSYWDYVKAAFALKVPVPGLGPLPVNILGAAGLGLVGLGFPPLLLIGLGLETAYLALVAGNPRFQGFVRGRNLSVEQESWNQRRDKLIASLGPNARRRYLELVTLSHAIIPAEDFPAGNLMRDNLAGLLWTHLRLLSSKEKVDSIRNLVDRGKGLQEIAGLEKRLQDSPPDSALHRSLEASLILVKKRIANLDRAEESAKVLEAEIERIERQVNLLREEAAVGQSPETITGHLDTITQSLEETGRWLNDNAEFLGDYSLPSTPGLPDPVDIASAARNRKASQ
jgi:hypothetical protein